MFKISILVNFILVHTTMLLWWAALYPMRDVSSNACCILFLIILSCGPILVSHLGPESSYCPSKNQKSCLTDCHSLLVRVGFTLYYWYLIQHGKLAIWLFANRQAFILHNLANRVTFVFSLDIKHSYIKENFSSWCHPRKSFKVTWQFTSLSTVTKNWKSTYFKFGSTNRSSIQIWSFFVKGSYANH